MFRSWFSRAESEADIPEPTADLSLGALLVRMAKADNEYHINEITMVDRVLETQFEISALEAAKMRATCETLEKMAPGTDRFVELIRDNVPMSQRRALIQALDDVARADGIKHDGEAKMIHELGSALGTLKSPEGE